MKRALVTGGSGDIGAAICRQLAAAGYHVVVHAGQNLSRADELVAELAAAGGSAESVCFDVADEMASRNAVEKLLNDEPIQVLVSNAGICADAPMAGMSSEQWHGVIDVSLNGFYNVCQPLLLPMMSTRWGRVIAISSVAGQMGNRGQANYAAAKAGLQGAVRSLSREIASRGITANVISPGLIEGSMTDGKFDVAAINEMVPAKRMGTPEEVAALAGFLASDQASYITGQVIGVNGGII